MSGHERLSRRSFLRLATLAGAGFIVGACTTDSPEVVEPVPTDVAEVEQVVDETATEVVEEVKEVVEEVPMPSAANLPGPRENCLIYGRTDIQKFDSFNPYVPGAYDWGTGMWAAMMEHLWYVNLATGDITPWLATDYEFNDDYTELKIFLRRGVKWLDGVDFTAEDVVFTTEMILDNVEFGAHSGFAEDVESVAAVDDYTVRWTFRRPAPRFHTNFMAWVGATPIAPKHIWSEADPVTFQNFPPVWTGPYELIPTTREDGMLVFKRRDDYWAVEQGLSEELAAEYFVVRIEPPVDAEVRLAIDNEVDIPIAPNYDMLETIVAGNPAFELSTYLDPCPRAIFFNCDTIKWPEVRRAIQYCCDRDLIGSVIWRPASHGTKFPWAGYGWLERFEFDGPGDKYPLEYNPAKAVEILDDLGFMPGADGIRVDDEGNRMSYLMLANNMKGDPEYEIAALLISELEKVGIEVELKGHGTWTPFYDTWTMGEADMSSHWACGATPDPVGFYNNFHSQNYKPIGEKVESPSWESSPCRLQDPRLDGVIEQIQQVDPMSPEALPLYEQALEYYLEMMPGFPSIETLYTMAFNNTYFTNWPNEGNWYMVPFTWWDTFKWVLHGIKKV